MSLAVKIIPEQIMRAKANLMWIFQKKQLSRLVSLEKVAIKLAITINKDNQHELESKYSQLEYKYST